MSIKFQTDQSGANNNICSGTSLTFNFSVANNTSVDTASFVIKKGSSTTNSIVCTIHDQPNGSGNVVESVSVDAANVSQTFGTVVFTFTNSNLNNNTSYSLVVSSTSSCSGSSPYSMKSGNFQVLDTTSNVIINTGYGIGASLQANTTSTASASGSYDMSATITADASTTAQMLRSTTNNSRIKIDHSTSVEYIIKIGL